MVPADDQVTTEGEVSTDTTTTEAPGTFRVPTGEPGSSDGTLIETTVDVTEVTTLVGESTESAPQVVHIEDAEGNSTTTSYVNNIFTMGAALVAIATIL
jgi:hypothetical protein